MEQRFFDAFQENPIIASVRDDRALRDALTTDVRVVFILYGDILSLPQIAEAVRAAGKLSVVHIDLIAGLSGSREIAVDYLRRSTCADGMISTHPNLVQRAKELRLFTLLRAFIIDSVALDALRSARSVRPDALDVLPGLMPSVIRTVREQTQLPVLTGGLITRKQEVLSALDAGALAISSARPEVWRM